MIHAIIFDFDGVIVDSERAKFSLVRELLEHAGERLPDESYPQFIGKKTRAFLSEEYPHLSQKQVDAIESGWRTKRAQDIPIPEMAQLLDTLHEKGVKIGVVTGSEEKAVRQALGHRAQYFGVLVTGEDAPSKPSSAGYILAAQILGVPKESILVVEDSAAGVQAAKTAGLLVWSVYTKELGADRHFGTHRELAEYLTKHLK